ASARSVALPRAHHPPALEGERERTGMPVSANNHDLENLELLLRRIIREEIGLAPVAPAAKWRGGTLVLRPSTPGLQEKNGPIGSFFTKTQYPGVLRVRYQLKCAVRRRGGPI